MFLLLLCHLLPFDVQIPNKLQIPPVPAHAYYNSSSSPPWKRSELVQHLVSASRPLPFGWRLPGHLSVWRHRLICAQQSGSGQPAAPEADLAAASDVKHTDQSLSKTHQYRWWWWRWWWIKLIFSSGEQLRSSAAVRGRAHESEHGTDKRLEHNRSKEWKPHRMCHFDPVCGVWSREALSHAF